MTLYKTRLPYDYFRCHGEHCDLKQDCLRHYALNDMGPRTSVVVRACDHADEFWPVEKESTV